MTPSHVSLPVYRSVFLSSTELIYDTHSSLAPEATSDSSAASTASTAATEAVHHCPDLAHQPHTFLPPSWLASPRSEGKGREPPPQRICPLRHGMGGGS
jgi:hypothetical protein